MTISINSEYKNAFRLKINGKIQSCEQVSKFGEYYCNVYKINIKDTVCLDIVKSFKRKVVGSIFNVMSAVSGGMTKNEKDCISRRKMNLQLLISNICDTTELTISEPNMFNERFEYSFVNCMVEERVNKYLRN